MNVFILIQAFQLEKTFQFSTVCLIEKLYGSMEIGERGDAVNRRNNLIRFNQEKFNI